MVNWRRQLIWWRMLVVAVVVVVVAGALPGIARAVPLMDDFDRPASVDVGNGWVESGDTADVDPQIVGHKVNWVNLAETDELKASAISRDIQPSNDVSVDMLIGTVGQGSGECYIEFTVYDAENNWFQIHLTDDVADNWQSVHLVSSWGIDTWTGVVGATYPHKYRVTVGDDGTVTAYTSWTQRWQSVPGRMGLIVKVRIQAMRYWRWHEFYADNFVAYDPAPQPTVIWSDDFNRDPCENVGNGWIEEGATNYIDPQIVNHEVSWVKLIGGDTRKSSWITHTYPASGDISVDLMLPKAANTTDKHLDFWVYDDRDNYVAVQLRTAIADPNNPDWQVVRIYSDEQIVFEGKIQRYQVYHNYQVRIAPTGQASVYFDRFLQWQSGPGHMGPSTKVKLLADRWWEWHQFYADNFVAAEYVPLDCQAVWDEGLGMAGDLNHDCEINLLDFCLLASQWLACNEPGVTGCDETWLYNDSW